MGEAKRRKQLGLMPTVHPFDAQLAADGTLTFTQAPDDAALRGKIEQALRLALPYGAAWDSQFRTQLVLHGRVDGTLTTAEDVAALPVAPHRHVAGELTTGGQPHEGDIRVDGGHVRLRGVQHSFDGQRWETFPANADPGLALRRLLNHPAARLTGETVASLTVEQYREGRTDIDPEPPADLLEAIEELAREYHGETDAEWLDIHRELAPDAGDGSPVAKRVVFDLTQPAPLQTPFSRAFAVLGNIEIVPQEGSAAYTLDGEEWVSYADGETFEGGLPAELADIFDLETVPVTVYADGRVEWDENEIPEEHAERLRTELRDTTGAGTPDDWAKWTRQMLENVYAEELVIPDGAELPVPTAVRLDIPLDALTDPDPLAQTFMESEVTFDGQSWRDLYDEELPEELSAVAHPGGLN
ncbi:hypothetical protein DEIGR_101297 [Deinococcus grandis]|uniref:Uncharacterized protein n=1 Tax=Deinococcus grandis TaxID=57498 RepID=A0A124BRH9_9DEIO|nr:hypothetical protein [Deinococcus grandis]BBN95238.1 hypothetical protein DEGR_19710 [Deinococcus grandis]GAQ21270.1 hypothetical protein DEIGR_101297 [Deinococcus grandis]